MPGGRGFTLVEVMVAVVIIGIAFVVLLSTHASSTRSYAEAKATTVSSLLAQQKIAEILAGDFPAPGEEEGTFSDYGNYAYVVTVRETELEELREVTVRVGLLPPEGDGEEAAVGGVAVVTYVADPGEEEEEEGEESAAAQG